MPSQFEFGHMCIEELQIMLSDVMRCPSSDDVDFILALTNEIARREKRNAEVSL